MIEFRSAPNNRIALARNGMNTPGTARPGTLWREFRGELMLDIGFLPAGLKWVSPARGYWLFQSPPRHQTIFYHHALAADARHTEVKSFSIPLPWTFMVVEVGPTYVPSRTWVFASNQPLGSLPLGAHAIGCLPLPNHYASGQICFPPSMPDRKANVGEAIALTHELTYGSYSNLDTSQNILWARRNGNIPPLGLRENLDTLKLLEVWEKTPISEVVESWSFPPPLDSFSVPEALFAGNHMLYSVENLLTVITEIENIGRRGQMEFALQSAFMRASFGE